MSQRSRTDLCGGCRATGIPTATSNPWNPWVLRLLAKQGLLKGGTIAVDATTLEANAALRSIVRRDSGESYEEFLKGLAAKSGIETPTREQLAKLDKKRFEGRGSRDSHLNRAGGTKSPRNCKLSHLQAAQL